jgi:general secretion pathway protein D
VNLGGIDQPVIGQRKVTHDIRMKEGQVNVLGGLMQLQETKTKTGIPGISAIPLVGRLFSQESISNDASELVIALVPHIIRKAEITAENLRGIAVGNQTVVKLNYGARPSDQPSQPAQPETPAPKPAPAPAAAGVPPAATPPATTTPAQPSPAPATPPPPPQPPVAVAPTAPPAAATPADQAKATVTLSPAQLQTQVGGTVTLNFAVSNAADLFSMPLTFTFDPRVVRLSDVTQGTVLSSDGIRAAFSKNIQNDSGTASVSISRMFGKPGVSGNGILLTLVFQGVAAGQSQVTLPQVGLRDSKGNLIPLTSDQPPRAVIVVR